MKVMKMSLTAAALMLAAISLPAQEIFDAVKANDLAKVKALVAKDAALVKAKDEAGYTPLHQAANIGSSALAQLLLDSGADINALNLQLNTPLHEAIRAKKLEVARLLVEKGADIQRQNINQKSPLHFAAQYDQMEMGRLLIAKGAAIDARDDYLRTPFLLVARQTGNVDFGKLLQKQGADINTQDRYGDKPLNLAAWRGWKGFIDWLLDLGADFDAERDKPSQMLGFAADCGSLRLFNVVIEKGGDLFADEATNRGLMRRTIAGGSVEIVKALLNRKIPLVTQANPYGWTPAHAAAANGHGEMIAFLAGQGVDLDVRTKSGKTAYNLAAENDRREVRDLLARLKADTGPQKFPELKGPYYGQKLPENEMLLFAADIVSSPNGDDNHGSITFTPDGREIYWNLRGKIWTARQEDGRWTMPRVAAFSQEGGSAMDDNPFVTPDGKRMFFTSNRPGAVSQDKENIWYVERTPDGWGQPQPVSAEVNALPLHWGISVAASGALYFGGIAQEGYGQYDIYCSRLEKGRYTKPVNLGPAVNGQGGDHCPYIAPDESYLIYSRMGGEEEGFFISYRGRDGQWTPPQKLPYGLEGVCPTVSPDGKFLFVLSDGVYWLPAAFIERLRPKSRTWISSESSGSGLPCPWPWGRNSFLREALLDHFLGENAYGSTEKAWRAYFFAFGYAASLKRHKAA